MTDIPVKSARRRFRYGPWVGAGGLLLIALLLLFRGYIVQGVMLPVRVTEGSMAPTLMGDHVALRCDACLHEFRFGSEIGSSGQMTVICPRCRTSQAAEPLTAYRGDRVWIQRWRANLAGATLRWEVTALRDLHDPARLLVKRVVGLPHESVDIRHGDVVVDGQLAMKSLDQLKSMAIAVSHEDCDRYSRPDGQSTWSGHDAAWRLTSNGWQFRSASGAELNWLSFAPPSSAGSSGPANILDDYGYNQGVSRRLNVVRDVLLQCELSPVDLSEIVFRFGDPELTWLVTWQISQRTVSISLGPRTLVSRKLVVPHAPKVARIDVGLFDGQLVMALNGTTVIKWRDERLAANRSSATPRLSIGASRGRTVIRRLLVDRDIYYLGVGQNPSFDLPCQLNSHEVFILGDNSPVSRDSRQLGPTPLPAVVGTVAGPLARMPRRER